MDRARPVDPMVNFKFAVTIDDFEELGFMEVSGLVGTFDVIEYREGTDPITPRKLRGQIKFDNVVLKKGITNDTSMEE
jgi:phage tail-like protein